MTATGFKWRSQRWNETERKQAPPLLRSTKVNAKYLKECTAPIENGGLKEKQRSIHPLIDWMNNIIPLCCSGGGGVRGVLAHGRGMSRVREGPPRFDKVSQ
ncbi:proteasome-associated protein ECM29-like protein isoform X1 [Iris pallida]|uniref:Proteasome-associated protein ECM29-like protein isoform X1 n=1 Tax=Iris pallida TaxID=29817 RepID=A0AAX6DNT6_IRIPA|nr:proteasome-associated protein ECM29-like protein isoform X1 [Iris pallida]